DNLILVRRAAGLGGRHGLVKEGHRKVAKVEQPRFDSLALPDVLKNPLRRLFRKPALTRAADDYRNIGHVLILLRLQMRKESSAMQDTSGGHVWLVLAKEERLILLRLLKKLGKGR